MKVNQIDQWEVQPAKTIPYGHVRRTLGGMLRKVCNTLLWRIAYHSPLNGVRVACHRLRGCHIGKNVYIGRHCFFDNMYPEYIYICDGASINAEAMLLTHFNPFPVWKDIMPAEVKPVVIGPDSIVAVRSTIMPGVRIGRMAVVSAGMTIEKDLPDYHIARYSTVVKTADMSPLMADKAAKKES